MESYDIPVTYTGFLQGGCYLVRNQSLKIHPLKTDMPVKFGKETFLEVKCQLRFHSEVVCSVLAFCNTLETSPGYACENLEILNKFYLSNCLAVIVPGCDNSILLLLLLKTRY